MRSMSGAVICALVVAAGSVGCGAGQAGQRDELGVTKVVLYQNGVGYFERYGKFDGDELKLRIRPDQINDILTSLTVLDTSKGGGVGSVSLPVEKNSWMVLGELPPQVRDAGGLLAVLSAFRGAEVSISSNTTSVTGRIIGVESHYDGTGESWRVTVLTSGDDLVPIEVDDIREVSLRDRTLTVGLEKALDVALGEGEWKPIELVVRFPHDGEHKVLMSYVVAMPTWKPVYRLILDEKRVRLQGWAVIDNVSGEDWNDVQLSLTAGAPISFIVDLHTPRLPSRPDLTARTFTQVTEAPPVALDAFGAADGEGGLGLSGAGAGGGGSGSGRGLGRMAAKSKPKADYARAEAEEASEAYYDTPSPEPSAAWAPSSPSMDSSLMMDSMVTETTGEKLGALFRYDVPVPVTVPDRSSALVTIINADVDGEDVMLYDPSSGSSRAQKHPYRAVRLNNTTEFVIERGPLTIYKDSTFVGEGLSNQIGIGQTVFIPYSLEPSVHIEQAYDWGQQEQRLITIKDGVMTVESYQLQKIDFTVTNNGDEPANVFLRVDKVPGYELKDTEAITQGEVYFVKVEAPVGGEPAKKTATQASKSTRTLSLFDGDAINVLRLYIADADADPAVTAQLEKILEFEQQLGDLEHRRSALNTRQNELRYRSNDLRSNIKVLGTSKANEALKNELVKKLGGVEDELATIDRELVELGEKKYATEVRLRESFQGITLTR